jgi:alcohol dehydrogenase class IV
MHFDFATSRRILFGPGRLAEAGRLAAGFGRHALLVTGAEAQRAAPLMVSLQEAGVTWTQTAMTHEPTTDDVSQGAALARQEGCTLVIGFGGGSALDAAKGIAALLGNGGNPFDYLEVVGAGKPLTRASAPCIAIPTTAGTGTEVTRNAVLLSPRHGVKASLRGDGMLPDVALVDPELSYGLPPGVTASSGMDALTQLIEPFVSWRANPMTDAFAREGIASIGRWLERAYRHGDDITAREQMSLAALYSGLAMANAGLGAVHGFAGVIGGVTGAPHGVVCAALLPHTMRVNVRALGQRAPEHGALRKYEQLGALLAGHDSAGAREAQERVTGLCASLAIPGLKALGVQPAQLDELADKASVSSSMKGNPIQLTREEMEEILLAAM